MYIYKTTNLTNGLLYVGQSTKSPAKSKNYYGSGVIFLEALKYYGKDNFTKEILMAELPDQGILNIMESWFIAKHKTNRTKYPELGHYNLNDGGNGQSGYRHRLDSCLKIKKAVQLQGGNVGKSNPNYGRRCRLDSQRILSSDDLTKYRELALNGTRRVELMEIFNCSYDTITRVEKELKLPHIEKPYDTYKQAIKYLICMQQRSISEVAAMFNCSYAVAQKASINDRIHI